MPLRSLPRDLCYEEKLGLKGNFVGYDDLKSSSDHSQNPKFQHNLRWRKISPYNFIPLNLNAFAITETELKLIASAAIIGDNSNPKTGYNTPAAIGIPNAL